jgi:hypothetical protein
VCASFAKVTAFVGSSSIRIPEIVKPQDRMEDSMATRPQKAAARERKGPAKPMTKADKKKFEAALEQIESQLERMETQLRDLKSIADEHSFWIIG